MKQYNSEQLVKKVESLQSFRYIPEDFWLVGVQSADNKVNAYDDTFYLLHDKEIVMTTTGTTNSGKEGLLYYKKYNTTGVAVIKTDEIYYKLWKNGYHKGKMPALIQNTNIKYYRDSNKNEKPEEIGKMYSGMIGINFHSVSYKLTKNYTSKIIGGWSLGCQVVNIVNDYVFIISKVKKQKTITYCLLKEF